MIFKFMGILKEFFLYTQSPDFLKIIFFKNTLAFFHQITYNTILSELKAFDEFGWIPEWPKGTDCKSAANCFGGSNPPPSIENKNIFILVCRSGGTGRRPGLKIPWVVIPVPVRFRSAALVKSKRNVDFTAFLLFFTSKNLNTLEHHTPSGVK